MGFPRVEATESNSVNPWLHLNYSHRPLYRYLIKLNFVILWVHGAHFLLNKHSF